MSKLASYAVFVFLFCKCVDSDLFYDVLRKVDPCEAFCEKTYPQSSKLGSCCRRGCRFFSLIYLVEDRTHVDLNSTRNTCQASCLEAYGHTGDRHACDGGCTSMACQKQTELLSQIDWSLYVEDGNMIVFEPGDLEPDDVLTDPGLRRQLSRGWAPGDDRLPETHIRTLPVAAEDAGRALGRGWPDCFALRTRLPVLAVALAVALPALLALWLWLAPGLRAVAALADYKHPLDQPPKCSLLVDNV
ncbi:transmembrane protein 59-like [Bacillus rossius redtenbacheri]|uniref:transmembrane protein 59-like n=1 Tax=Bacillus rossius redtenbacheri TaxID=93214 RepID=UPI002FDE7BA5